MSAVAAVAHHAIARVNVSVRSPKVFGVIAFAALLASTFLHPEVEFVATGMPLVLEGFFPVMVAYLVALWVKGVVAGRSTGAPGSAGLFIAALPTLPIGRRGRVLAEAAAALVLILVVHLALSALVSYAYGFQPFEGIPRLVCMLVPYLLLHDLGARGGSWRSSGVTLAIFAVQLGAQKLEWLTAGAGQVLVATALSAAALLVAGRFPSEERARSFGRVALGRARRTRPGPQTLARDRWVRPLRWALKLGAIFALVEAAAVGLAMTGVIDRTGLGWAHAFLFMAAVFATVYPYGLNLATAGAGRLLGPTEGGFLRAWSTLPVRRSVVLRGVYLHGLVAGSVLWLLALGLSLGTTAIVDPGGESRTLLFPLLVLVPCLAGYMTSAAAGAAYRAFIPILIAPFSLLLLVIAEGFGSPSLAAAGVVLFGVIGGGPALLLVLQAQRAERVSQ